MLEAEEELIFKSKIILDHINNKLIDIHTYVEIYERLNSSIINKNEELESKTIRVLNTISRIQSEIASTLAKGKLTDKEIEQKINNVKATQAVEGSWLGDMSIEFGTKYLKGEMSSEEINKEITDYIMEKKEEIDEI